MKKILIFLLLSIILVTGCAETDVVLQEKENLNMGFLSSKDELQASLNKKEEWVDKVESNVIRQKMSEIVELTTKENEFTVNSRISVKSSNFKRISNPKKPYMFDEGRASFIFDTEDGLHMFWDELKKLGYSELDIVSSDMDSKEIALVRKGIRFKTVYRTGQTTVSLKVPVNRICYPKKFEDILENQIVDGFYVKETIVGETLDCIALLSSYNEPGSNYNKRINIYCKEGKIIQIEMILSQHSTTENAKVFTIHEQQTMINLLTRLVGNSVEAKVFVENFQVENATDGTLGECDYTIESRGKVEGNPTYHVIFQ